MATEQQIIDKARREGRSLLTEIEAKQLLKQAGVSVTDTTLAISKEQAKHLAWGLVLSGIAMSISGNSRPASGAEHKISHAIDYLFPGSVSHGFTVSVGNVVAAFLHEQYQKEIISFNVALGLPVVSDDIGIKKKEFVEVILHAATIRPDRYTILEKKSLTQDAVFSDHGSFTYVSMMPDFCAPTDL